MFGSRELILELQIYCTYDGEFFVFVCRDFFVAEISLSLHRIDTHPPACARTQIRQPFYPFSLALSSRMCSYYVLIYTCICVYDTYLSYQNRLGSRHNLFFCATHHDVRPRLHIASLELSDSFILCYDLFPLRRCSRYPLTPAHLFVLLPCRLRPAHPVGTSRCPRRAAVQVREPGERRRLPDILRSYNMRRTRLWFHGEGECVRSVPAMRSLISHKPPFI